MSGICVAQKSTAPAIINMPGLDAGDFRGFCILVLSFLGLNLPEPCCAGTAPLVPQIEARVQTSEKPVDPVIWGLSMSKLPIILDLIAPLGSSCALVCEYFQAGDELAARLPGGGELISDPRGKTQTRNAPGMLRPIANMAVHLGFGISGLLAISFASRPENRPECIGADRGASLKIRALKTFPAISPLSRRLLQTYGSTLWHSLCGRPEEAKGFCILP